jgi:hypothetical protein
MILSLVRNAINPITNAEVPEISLKSLGELYSLITNSDSNQHPLSPYKPPWIFLRAVSLSNAHAN